MIPNLWKVSQNDPTVHSCASLLSCYLCQLTWWVGHLKKIKCWGLTPFYFQICLIFYFLRGSCPLILFRYTKRLFSVSSHSQIMSLSSHSEIISPSSPLTFIASRSEIISLSLQLALRSSHFQIIWLLWQYWLWQTLLWQSSLWHSLLWQSLLWQSFNGQEANLEAPSIYKGYVKAMWRDMPPKYGLIWYSTSALGSEIPVGPLLWQSLLSLSKLRKTKK